MINRFVLWMSVCRTYRYQQAKHYEYCVRISSSGKVQVVYSSDGRGSEPLKLQSSEIKIKYKVLPSRRRVPCGAIIPSETRTRASKQY